jgi:sugar phosphate isomerase/epimerase
MKNYKNKFPFKIGTTSYILHAKKDNIIKNINFLKDKFDKIQLLLFGKDYLDIFLNSYILNYLQEVKKNYSIEYSIHLPIDLELLNDSLGQINKSLDIIYQIIEKTVNLKAKEYILHIDKYKKQVELNKNNFKNFKKVCKLIKNRMANPEYFYIENTNYDLTYFKDIILENGFSVCLDIGHLFNYKQDFSIFISSFNKVIKEMHIHGIKNGKDHLSLNKLDKKYIKLLINYLTNYKKSVTIEVFNKSDLIKSLKFLKKEFQKG